MLPDPSPATIFSKKTNPDQYSPVVSETHPQGGPVYTTPIIKEKKSVLKKLIEGSKTPVVEVTKAALKKVLVEHPVVKNHPAEEKKGKKPTVEEKKVQGNAPTVEVKDSTVEGKKTTEKPAAIEAKKTKDVRCPSKPVRGSSRKMLKRKGKYCKAPPLQKKRRLSNKVVPVDPSITSIRFCKTCLPNALEDLTKNLNASLCEKCEFYKCV